MPKTSVLRSTTTAENNPHASTRTGHKVDKKREKEKERRQLSNLFKASTSKIGPELDLALETSRVEVSLERSVQEERFAHVRLMGGWSGGGLGGARLGEGAGQRMVFKYDPSALPEAVFGRAAGAAEAMKRRKVESAVEEGGGHTKDPGGSKEGGASEGGCRLAC